ncbi:MAG: hypothetical protein LBD58_13265, partial [Treponema sp.]|nr:hypothetical protein [Treponema sp.]
SGEELRRRRLSLLPEISRADFDAKRDAVKLYAGRNNRFAGKRRRRAKPNRYGEVQLHDTAPLRGSDQSIHALSSVKSAHDALHVVGVRK